MLINITPSCPYFLPGSTYYGKTPESKILCSVTEVWVWQCLFGESEKRVPAQLWGSCPPYFGKTATCSPPPPSTPILSACADTQRPFPTSSLKPNWQPENPWAPGSISPVVLFCLYLYFMISHLEGKTERAIFFFRFCPAGGRADSEQYKMILPGAEVILRF